MNFNKILIFGTLICTLVFNAQDKKEVLFTIDNKPYYSDEFIRIYKKNLDLVKDESQKDLNAYMDLFLIYKMKVNKANKLGLQNSSKYQSELASYRSQLAKTYLNDVKVTNKLIEEAYERGKYEVRASHLLIGFDEGIKGADTVTYYNKALELKKKIDSGAKFEDIAVENSTDPSVKENKGDLGYFSAFRMVYPFESAAFKTPVGKVSMPVRTKFGYHLIKVVDKRENLGEITVAHIMSVKPQNPTDAQVTEAKTKINDIYAKLKSGQLFETLAKEFSDDKASGQNGGQLNRFGSGQLSAEEFEKVAFGLKNKGDYSEPVETKYGFHIIKLIAKHPVGKLEELKPELENKIKRDDRAIIITNSLAQKLRGKYKMDTNSKEIKFVENQVTDDYYVQTWEMPKLEGLKDQNLLTINKDKSYNSKEFLSFLNSQQKNGYKTKPKQKLIQEVYSKWQDEKLIEYYTNNLENEFVDFKNVMDEYRDGLLLFDLMEQEIWNKAKTDSIGQMKYYEKNKSKYNWNKRYDSEVVSFTDKTLTEKIKKALNDKKSLEEIEKMFNEKDKILIETKKGLFEANQDVVKKITNPAVGTFILDKETNGTIFAVRIGKVKEPEGKTFDEAKSKVINDYQQELETNWPWELKKEFKTNINQSVFDKIKAQFKK